MIMIFNQECAILGKTLVLLRSNPDQGKPTLGTGFAMPLDSPAKKILAANGR
jgi:hypothetical protein